MHVSVGLSIMEVLMMVTTTYAPSETPRVAAAPALFDPRTLDGLPEAAKRYLAHAIAPGTALAAQVRLTMSGCLQRSPEQPEMRFEAWESLLADRFAWEAHVRMGPLRLDVHDHYGIGEGGVRVTFLHIPVVRAQGENVRRSAWGRLVAERVWLPSLLLPGPDVIWSADSDREAIATVRLHGETAELHLEIAESGALECVWLDRWGDVGRKGFGLIPFGMRPTRETTITGYTIPAAGAAGWWFGTGRYEPFFDFEIVSADFSANGAAG